MKASPIGIVGILCIASSVSFSQLNFRNLEIGGGISSHLYFGDLTPAFTGSFKTAAFGGLLFFNKQLNNVFKLRTNIAIGKLKGDESRFSEPAWRQQRNFKFKSQVVEISELLLWEVLGKANTAKSVAPYVFAGAGLSFLNIKRDWTNFNAAYFGIEPHVATGLAEDQDHSVPKIIPVLPMGAGAQYSFAP